LHLTFEYASKKACISSTGLLYLPLKPDEGWVACERLFGLQLLLVWKDLFRTAGLATLQGEQKSGRALHGAGAEGVPRSASTVWSVMA
jgi:hypothetical protein